jgi:hypothetical protein
MLDSDGDALMMDDGHGAEQSGQHTHSNHNRQNRGAASGKGAVSDIAGGPLFSVCQSGKAPFNSPKQSLLHLVLLTWNAV